jgi:hypothetical protein
MSTDGKLEITYEVQNPLQSAVLLTMNDITAITLLSNKDNPYGRQNTTMYLDNHVEGHMIKGTFIIDGPITINGHWIFGNNDTLSSSLTTQQQQQSCNVMAINDFSILTFGGSNGVTNAPTFGNDQSIAPSQRASISLICEY